MSDDLEAAQLAIEVARQEIDEVDLEIVRLLGRRAAAVQRIGGAKQTLGEPVYQPDREERIFSRVLAANEGPLDDGAIRRLFERILDEARRLERHTVHGDEHEEK